MRESVKCKDVRNGLIIILRTLVVEEREMEKRYICK